MLSTILTRKYDEIWVPKGGGGKSMFSDKGSDSATNGPNDLKFCMQGDFVG